MRTNQIMTIFVKGIVLAIAFLGGTAVGQVQTQRQAIMLEDPLSVSFEAEALDSVISQLMHKHQIYVGFEQSASDVGNMNLSFEVNGTGTATKYLTDGVLRRVEVKRYLPSRALLITAVVIDGTLKQVMDVIVSQLPGYAWQINQGVINIYPSKRDPGLAALLDLEIREFSLPKGATVRDITAALKRNPDLRYFLERNEKSFSGVRPGSDMLNETKYGAVFESDIKFVNVRLRELLNNLAKLKKGGWIVRYKSGAQLSRKQALDIDI